MKRIIVLISLILLLFPVLVFAETEISNLGVRVIDAGSRYTKYSWKMDIYSDTSKSSCMLNISFRDSEDFEIHSATDFISLSQGSNHFTGQGICKNTIWEQIDHYTADVKCH